MLLEILIPTYNRINYLKKNIETISKIVKELDLTDSVSIFISDNCSTDDTESVINSIIGKSDLLQITYHRQKTNLGYLLNFKYLIENCNSEYFMLLGDDDYPDFKYIEQSISIIKADKTAFCILPAVQAIDEDGKIMKGGRDLNCIQSRWKKGFENLYENSLRAHQISGIILKNSGIKRKFEDAFIQNLYPQIFLTGLACLSGDTIHIPQYPMKVTQTVKKDWKYDRTGLLCDIFENYAKLGLTQYERFKCESKFIQEQSWRIMRDRKYPVKQIINICNLSFNRNTSIIGHFLHPFTITGIWIKNVLSYCKNQLKDRCRQKYVINKI